MKAKHTPGPWRVMSEEASKDYIRIRGTVPGGAYKVANVLAPVYARGQARELQETRANAYLIAAAPDLLAALEEALHYLSFHEQDDARHMERIRAAITKASYAQQMPRLSMSMFVSKADFDAAFEAEQEDKA